MSSIVIDGIRHEADFNIAVKIKPESDFEKEALYKLKDLEIHDVPIFIVGMIEFKGISKDGDGECVNVIIHPK